jgi:hypothetical protein
MRYFASTIGLALVLSAVLAPGAVSAAGDPSIYWGAYIQGAPFNSSLIDTFQATTGKHMSIVTWGEPWVMNGEFQAFQTTTFQSVRDRGALPMLTWGSWELGKGETQPNFQLADIASGKYDSFIRQWATDARAWGQPLFLRMDHEMNGWWYPWNEQLNGNAPGDYVRMWRHVHDIFTSVGANNVTWVWCPNIVSPRSTPTAEVYPGSSYVDWTCMDGYNWGTDKDNSWQTFTEVVSGSAKYGGHNTYEELLSVAPDKPIMIGEIGASEHGGSKSAWIKDMLSTQLPTQFPAIKAIIWNEWNSNPITSWEIESSSAATSAFKAGIASSTYATNAYSSASGKILAPQAAAVPSQPAQGGSTTTTLLPVADTYTSRAAPTSTAGGTSLFLRADRTGSDTAFVRFDLSSLGDKTISQATLRVHTNSLAWAGSKAAFQVHPVTSTDWKEQFMSFSNTVPISPSVLGTLTGGTVPSTWYSIPLTTQAVQGAIGDLFSIAITSPAGDVLIVDSREAGGTQAPQLVLSYK